MTAQQIKLKPFVFCIVLLLIWQPEPRLLAATAEENQTRAVQALRMCLEDSRGSAGPHSQLMNAMVRFYEDRQFRPAWMCPEGLTPQGAALFDALKSSSGPKTPELNTYIRHLDLILQDGRQWMPALSTTFPVDALLRVETGMTESALYYVIRHRTDNLLTTGNPLGPEAAAAPPAAAGLAEALEGSTWNALLKAAAPRQQPFLALQKALERYTAIQLLGGWPTIPEGNRILPGCKDSRVPLLRRRLVISGDAGLETLGMNAFYDDALAAGVRRFQHRHGLIADGVVGPATLAELNISVQERINQIKLNMLRWSRLPERLGQRYLIANIPGFRLDVVENHQVVRSMRTIVGKSGRPTPVISAMMTYLEINPYWNIPQQIARVDILPKIQNDPGFLLQNDIQVFDSWKENALPIDPLAIDWKRCSKTYFPFRLRQNPSTANALGRIKFIFPNRFSVYIHDTPSRSLFCKTNRSFSSGCVRIEDPLALAGELLAGQGWSKDKIEAKVKRGKRSVVVLKKPVPVYLVYMTTWTGEDDTIYFYHDLYGLDQRLREELIRPDDLQPVRPSDLMAIERVLEKSNDSAAAAPSGQNDAAGV